MALRVVFKSAFNKFSTMPSQYLPYFTKGDVIKGFGRGSKQLGCPTANFPRSVVDSLPKDFPTGVYYGWATLDNSPIYKMVMNIGWCPYYNNEQKSMETHILHKFDNDFYGLELKVCIVGYLRGEMNFNSLEDLVTAIQKDISDADNALNNPEHQVHKTDPFFASP